MEGHPGHDEAAPVTIGGSSGNITTSRSSMSMSMDMTFTNWSTSSLTLLLTSYKITKPWQFFLTWLAVFLATILTHVIRFAICSLDCAIANSVKSNPCHKGTYGPAGPGDASTFQTSKRIARPNGWLVLKLLHGLMTGCNYGLSLILMLVSNSTFVN